ncbi:hypothetical protein TSUD_203610 [Trifolium subterraneum]|uniref:Uncharacterized protein n=1 Tax=Trifolium subterraneum TaxID=3900 RepID=A0A2Z6LWH7_TRISU|nr:hypothetical protein TSUD_203610 [Trifolium subterraneum]
MAYHLCSSSPSSFFHDPPSISSRKLKLPNFSFSFQNPSQSKRLLHVSLQEPIPQQQQDVNSEKDPKSSSSKISYVWVNPKSPRAKQLGKKSYDARYNSLVKFSNALDSCHPNEHDVSQILDRLGDKFVEQDVVIIINYMENSVIVPFVLRYFQRKIRPTKEGW